MTTTALQRIESTAVQEIRGVDELARITGYKGLNRLTIIHDLVRIGICPFDPEGVQKYKDGVTGELNKKENSEFNLRWLRLCIWASLFLGVPIIAVGFLSDLSQTAPLLSIPTVVLCTILGSGCIDRSARIDMWRWELVEISRYSEKVPVNVVRLAAEIKLKLPDVGLYVDGLTKRRIITADPFLVISRGEALAHVAVWDEPSFDDVSIEREDEK